MDKIVKLWEDFWIVLYGFNVNRQKNAVHPVWLFLSPAYPLPPACPQDYL